MIESDLQRVWTDEDGKWLPQAERTLLAVSGAREVPASAGMMATAERLLDHYREQDEQNPKRDDTELKNDIVYRLGMREGIRRMLAIPDAARTIIKNQREGA